MDPRTEREFERLIEAYQHLARQQAKMIDLLMNPPIMVDENVKIGLLPPGHIVDMRAQKPGRAKD